MFYQIYREINGYIYSIDMLMVVFNLRDDLEVDTILKAITKGYSFKHVHNNSYERSIYITLPNNSKVNIRLNHFHKGYSYIKFNPNTCNSLGLDIAKYLLQYSSEYFIKSLDIAIDFPYLRNLVSLKKDRRKLLTIQTSIKDKGTQYLGTRKGNGQVKLYDKQKESKLDYPLTRVEFTLGNPLDTKWDKDLKRILPTVYIPNCNTDYLNNIQLSSTEAVLVDLLTLEASDPIPYLQRLYSTKRNKLEPLVTARFSTLKIDENIVNDLAISAYEFIEIPNAIYADNTVIIDNLVMKGA